MAEQNTNESGLESGFLFDVRIPPECLDDEGVCPHSKKEVKRDQNPV